MFERAFTASGRGPAQFFVEGDFVKAEVTVGDCDRAYAVLSTHDDPGDPGQEAIKNATFGSEGDWEHLKVPFLPGGGGGTTVIQTGSGDMYIGQSAHVVSGSMTGVVMTGDIVVNGVRITPELLKAAERAGGKKSGVSHGIELALHLPRGSSLRAEGKMGTYLVTGRELHRVRFKSYNGGLDLRVPCVELDADTYNGDVHAAVRVDQAEAETYNGNVILSQLYGNGRLKSYNGNVTALCYAPGRVKAKTYNGNTDVRDMASLGGQLEVDAVTRNGSQYGRKR
jgi:hypothetical protein